MPARSLISFGLVLALAACYETTSTQRDYTAARDLCRGKSELNVSGELRARGAGNKEYKTALLKAFSTCMERQGWSVTSPNRGKEAPPKVAAQPTVVPQQAYVPPARPANSQLPPTSEQRRADECRYARQAMHHSSNARAIAKSCDIECANKKKVAPRSKPAACTL